MCNILVVDDEPDLRTLYELALVREGYPVFSVGDLAQAWEQLDAAQRFDVVITDMRLPDGLGISLLQRLRENQRRERCVVITAYGSADNAVESLKAGAFDYLTKPVDIQQFRSVIASAVLGAPQGSRGRTAAQRRAGLARGLQPAQDRCRNRASARPPCSVWWASRRPCARSRSGWPRWRGRWRRCWSPASPAPARNWWRVRLHANSHRSAGPMVAVNCSAIPENLLEAEFFGSRKGAFTGATQDRDGFFQAARGGSLFLDEIGDLPLAMQSKLLRAIQERSVRSVGSTQEEPVDVRIISATHRDLAAEVQAGGSARICITGSTSSTS